jgi:putative SOS response-associated peptidase YedK
MCGRYVSSSSSAVLESYLSVDEVKAEPLEESYNVAPTDEVYVVVERDDRRLLGTMKWGLVPWFSKDPKTGAKMINARAESVPTKPAFRRAFEKRRCLIPADGFYEWKKPTEDGGKKIPYFIHGADGRPIVFAGLWEIWKPRDASGAPASSGQSRRSLQAETVLSTCTIITTSANDLLRSIHDRMPVVLPPERWEEWLDPMNDDVEALRGLMVPAPNDLLELYPISTKVNSVRNDGPELIEPASGER